MKNKYLQRFLSEKTDEKWGFIAFLSISSGVANGALLGIINGGAEASSDSELKIRFFFMFIVAMAIFCYAKKVSMSFSIRMIEKMLHSLRVRVVEKLRWSELRGIESFTKGDIYTKVSQDTMTISQSAFFLVNIAQSCVMVVCCLIYIAWLSIWTFIITVTAIGLALTVYWSHRKRLSDEMAHMSEKESKLVNVLSHIIEGYKEIRVNTRKNNAVFKHYVSVAEESKAMKVKANDTFIIEIMFSQVFFYLLIAAVVFILPHYIPTYSIIVIKTTAAILFVVGPLDMIATTAPLISRSNAALKNIYDLEDSIPDNANETVDTSNASKFSDFQSISTQQMSFSYCDEDNASTFSVGPLDLEIKKGEIIFFVGGNGCGKTTLMKLLTGLYTCDTGNLCVDNHIVDKNSIQNYRELFSHIFAEFHLFERNYGLEDVEDSKFEELIEQMELSNKTTFKNGSFSNQNLSTGQRKRLALISAILEDRPILMFDEWAADQDPQFRKHFYEKILPDLKKANKTIIAVSHDDRYWHVADRVFKMEYGQFLPFDSSQIKRLNG